MKIGGKSIRWRAGREFYCIDRCVARDEHRRWGVAGERRRTVGHGWARTPVRARSPLVTRTLPGAVDRLRGCAREQRNGCCRRQ